MGVHACFRQGGHCATLKSSFHHFPLEEQRSYHTSLRIPNASTVHGVKQELKIGFLSLILVSVEPDGPCCKSW